ncbi:MAG TPA: NUDIX domain-containing protein [Rhizomicrobium sp.]|nr:NUDIX domain-containing protein [Rhizomicrobium sp.]
MSKPDHEVSAGGLVVASIGDILHVALVLKHEGRWVLPKGHVDPGEKLEQAAIREVTEESSLSPGQLKVLRYLGAFDFNEHDPSGGKKLNHFFLMAFVGEELPRLRTDPKHAAAAWHVLPLRGIDMAYEYQEALINGIQIP